TDIMRPVPNIVIPFFAFALGTGIDLGNVVTGGASGLVVGVITCVITAIFAYLGYRFILRRGRMSGIGIASATTAGNAIATPAIVGGVDPRFEPYVEVATAQVASAVLVTAILAPILAAWVLKRQGGLLEPEELEAMDAEIDASAQEPPEGTVGGTVPPDEGPPGRDPQRTDA